MWPVWHYKILMLDQNVFLTQFLTSAQSHVKGFAAYAGLASAMLPCRMS